MLIVRRGPRVPEQAQHFWPTTKRLIAYLRPWRVGVIVSILLAVISVILSILAPKILGEATTIIYDGMLKGYAEMKAGAHLSTLPINFTRIWQIGITVILLYLFSGLFSFLQLQIMTRVSQRVVYNLRQDFEEKIIENHVSLFILCSPHNPAGRVWTREELKRLLTICRRHNVFVISDEIHQDITFNGHTHIPSFTAGAYDDIMITVTAPSKTFNLAGCQNSVIIIPDEALRKKWDEYITGIRILNGNAFGYIAAEAAYRDGRQWFEEVREIIYGNYLFVKDTFTKELPKAVVSPLEGTYLCWIDMKAYVKPENMKEFMQKKCRLALDYGDWFGGERFASFVRMNLATSRENVEKAVAAIVREV